MKQYFTPMLLTASVGNIDLTKSQEGEIGTGITDMEAQFAEWGITPDILASAERNPACPEYSEADPDSWMTLYEWLYNNGYVS